MHILALLVLVVTLTNAEITPIINSTGEYFIANSTSNSFLNQTISCNSSISNCFMICSEEQVCLEATFECASSNCSIQCSKNSCQSIKLDVSNSISTKMSCKGQGSCNSMTLSSSNASDSSDISLICNGVQSCSKSQIKTNHSSLMIDCQGAESCQYQSIDSRNNKHFTYQCYKNATSSCKESKLKVSPNSQSTEILCNGRAYSESCDYLDIQVSVDVNNHAFLDIKYVNNSGDPILAGDDSAAYIHLYCVDDGGNKVECTEDVEFPIIGVATPTNSTSSTEYYANPSGYAYRYKEIICKANKTCNIECLGDQSCNYVSIQTKSQDTSLKCNAQAVCENVVLESSGKDISIECEFSEACTDLKMLHSSSGNVDLKSCA